VTSVVIPCFTGATNTNGGAAAVDLSPERGRKRSSHKNIIT